MNNFEFDWLFYSIYPGNIDMLDSSVEQIVKPAVEKLSTKVNLAKWFFIRYLDETGAHIRLRFYMPIEEMELAMDFLEGYLDQQLDNLKDMPVQVAKRLLPLKQGNNEMTVGSPRIELSLYEPEVDKYGGPEWIERVEDLFYYSSILNINLIEQIRGEQVNRFNLGLRLMYETLLRAEEDLEKRVTFLEEYIQYWSGDRYRKDSGTMVSDSFKKSAVPRIDITKTILQKNLADYPEFNAIDDYQNCTRKLFTDLRDSSIIEEHRNQFCFNIIHMMNNRLGIWPIEESYLAALLFVVIKDESLAST